MCVFSSNDTPGDALPLSEVGTLPRVIRQSVNPVGLTGPRLTKPFLSATRSAVCRSAGCRILTRNVLVKTSAVVVPARTRSPITASSSIVTRGGRRGKSRYSYSAFAGSGILDDRGTRLLRGTRRYYDLRGGSGGEGGRGGGGGDGGDGGGDSQFTDTRRGRRGIDVGKRGAKRVGREKGSCRLSSPR